MLVTVGSLRFNMETDRYCLQPQLGMGAGLTGESLLLFWPYYRKRFILVKL